MRTVSMPSWELFDLQPAEYRNRLLPPEVKTRLAVECGCPMGWHRYVGNMGDVMGIKRFGASAPGHQVTSAYGFTPEDVCTRGLRLLHIQPQ